VKRLPAPVSGATGCGIAVVSGSLKFVSCRNEEVFGLSDWNALAELDPLWTILSEPDKKFGKWDPVEFFRRGEDEAKRVLAMCRENSVNISFGRFLDFGCGVGRMTRGFSEYFQSGVGIDVSEKMVGLARQFNSGLSHCEFIASDSATLPLGNNSFDFIFSVLVLQHLPSTSAILRYIAEFVRITKKNGVIVFQVPIRVPLRRRLQLRRRLWSLLSSLGVPQRWLFQRLGLTPIQISGVSRKKVESFIAAQGASLKSIQRYDLTEGDFHSNYYFVVKN
jgi:SAM-dependent methyltransferase